ncbi:putative O-antigen polymerase family protein [Candidatus Sulfopaludibacter sp. SbA4]|nr:putative O-antigen polymerase family protein [Candidatus Sulfopaludibacter sp. SbA4]
MPSDSGSRVEPLFYGSGISQIRFTEQSATATTGAPVSYWLLLTFLFLLYANLPFVLPATEVVRPAAVVAGAALVMLLVETMFGRRTLSFAWPEGTLLLGFVGAAALSCLTALWPRQAAESLSDLVKMALVYFFIANCANTERRLRGVMWTIVICGLIPAAGTLQHYLQGNLTEGRASWLGIFANPNEVAYSLVILVPIAAFLATGLGLFPRLALLGISIVYIGAIFVTFSRGGLVGLAAVVGLYAWRKRSIWLQAVLVALVAAGLVLGGKYWSRGEDFSGLNGDVSFRQRLATSAAGLAMFADHPLLGVGLGCSVIAWPLYAPNDLYSRGALVTHNTVIQPLGETGILGFIPFALFVGFGIYYARKLALDKSRRSMANLGAGLEIAVWGFVVCGLSGGYVLTWFPYILLGMVSSARRVQGEG